jgi:uncharacterized membrane protein
MTNRPILNPLNRILIGLLALVTAAGFFIVPLDASLPIHWNLQGVADNFAPTPIALLIPAIMAAVALTLFFIVRRTGLRKDMEAGRHVIQVANSFILGLAILLTCATIAVGVGYDVDMPRAVVFAMAALLLILGNSLPKSQPNRIAGIRLPWTLRDPANWTIVHRWTGRLMMLGGAVALLAALLNPPSVVLLVVVLLAAFLPIIAGVAISYVLARR